MTAAITFCPPACKLLLPLMPSLAQLCQYDARAVHTICNVGLNKSCRPHLQSARGVVKALQQMVASAKDARPTFEEYRALTTLVSFSGEDSQLRKSVIQPQYLKWMMDKLVDPRREMSDDGETLEFYAQVMHFPVLASFADARAKLHELGAIEALCGFCVKIGLGSANHKRAIDLAFESLAILMCDSVDNPWKDTASDEFKELIGEALGRAHLRPQAQKISFLILD